MRSLVIVLSAFVIVTAGLRIAAPEEELFDIKTAVVHRDRGISLLKAKNYKAAVAELEESVSIAPNAEAYYYLGYAYYYEGRAGNSESRKKSIECFDRAYELDSSYTPSRYRFSEPVSADPKESMHPASLAPQPSPDETVPTAPEHPVQPSN